LPISLRIQWLPKAGNRDDEYEDACWPDRALMTAQPVVRCAIADGATESAFAGLWARQLVAAYAAGDAPDAEGWLAALPQEQARWQAQIAAKALPWYAEEKARSGAFAALLGVTISGAAGATARPWQASSLGDCALFHVRGDALLTSFPATSAAFFTSRPLLIPSVPGQNAALASLVQQASGVMRPGDVLYLVTDALGQWFLQQVEDGAAPWRALETALAGHKRGFRRWIAGLRGRGHLRNDDVTLLRIGWAER
jgi:hypothetical protein